MNPRHVAWITVAAVAVIAIAAVVAYRSNASHNLQLASKAPTVGKAAVGQPAPPFEIATTHGLFDLSATKKPVFLEVFATWCPHCQRETAVIDKLYHAYGDRVDFVGISGSDTGMDGATAATQLDVVNWAQRFHVEYPVAFDAPPALAVSKQYLQGAFPTLAVIDRNKNVAYLNTGEISYDELAAAIQKVL